jgi:hypothetical protein
VKASVVGAAGAGLTGEQYRVVAEQLLLPALQLARSPPAVAVAGVTSAPAAAAAAAGQGVVASFPKQQGRLRLTSFTSNLRAAGMLGTLPADSLTALQLSPIDSIGADGCRLSALIARLSSVKQLSLAGAARESMPGSCLEGIAQLTGLTALELSGYWPGVEESLQQLLSQSLPLRRLSFTTFAPVTVLDMTALASLTELLLYIGYELQPGLKLPVQLQQFCLMHCRHTSALLGLQHLQRVRLGVAFEDPEQLRCLAQLPALRHVSLEYDDAETAAPTAPAWQHLSQLSELTLEYVDRAPSEQEMAAILAGVAAATSLTKLSLEARALMDHQDDEDDNKDDDEEGEVAACASLAGLTCLRDLTISYLSRLVPGDALALTALTSLTRLKLASTGSAVDDVAASALACSLTRLRSLDLGGCALGGLARLAPIAQLSQLTELQLAIVGGMTRRGVMLLTKLTQLQQLTVQHNDEVTQEWMDQEFWAALRQR